MKSAELICGKAIDVVLQEEQPIGRVEVIKGIPETSAKVRREARFEMF